jgi:hypothetical protein
MVLHDVLRLYENVTKRQSTIRFDPLGRMRCKYERRSDAAHPPSSAYGKPSFGVLRAIFPGPNFRGRFGGDRNPLHAPIEGLRGDSCEGG